MYFWRAVYLWYPASSTCTGYIDLLCVHSEHRSAFPVEKKCRAMFRMIMRCFAVSHYKYSLSKILGVSVGLPVRHCMPLYGSPSWILSWTGLPTQSFDFLNIDKMLRWAIAIKLNGEKLLKFRILYTPDSLIVAERDNYFKLPLC